MKTRFFAAALLVASCIAGASMAEPNATTAGSAIQPTSGVLNPLSGIANYQAPIDVDVKAGDGAKDYRAEAGTFCNGLSVVQATPSKYHTCVNRVAPAMMQAAKTGDQPKVYLDDL